MMTDAEIVRIALEEGRAVAAITVLSKRWDATKYGTPERREADALMREAMARHTRARAARESAVLERLAGS